MKRILTLIAALALAASCTSLKEEFEPVFTGKYSEPAVKQPVQMTANTTIAELCAMYSTGKPWDIDRDIIISGKVSTTDQPGNFYKSLYIQDGTAGIELKIGKNGLYNFYKEGQTLYVRCNGLTLGMYGYKTGSYGGQGMVQIGYNDPTGSYETSYLEANYLIDSHIFCGEQGEKLNPVEVTADKLPSQNSLQASNPYLGCLVTLKGLKYANEAFCLIYINSNKDKTLSANRIFISDAPHGITTWAMSETKFKEYLDSGVWDDIKIGNANDYNYGTVGEPADPGFATSKEDIRAHAAAYSVSQYFKLGSHEIQLRTSGYSKFGDGEIPQEVLSGSATVDITGILTLYQGSLQLIVNSLDDIKVNY